MAFYTLSLSLSLTFVLGIFLAQGSCLELGAILVILCHKFGIFRKKKEKKNQYFVVCTRAK